jgi:hypothetical protein
MSGFGFSDRVMNEGLHLFIGKLLGEGLDRKTYVFLLDRTRVVKVEDSTGERFQNVREWLTWRGAKDAKNLARWLAPCHHISDCGTFLIQERTTPIVKRDVPRRVPKFLGDLKYTNWGRLADGRVVCHDYGTNLALEHGLSIKTVKASFWTHS